MTKKLFIPKKTRDIVVLLGKNQKRNEMVGSITKYIHDEFAGIYSLYCILRYTFIV
jgi:hypothetical protein